MNPESTDVNKHARETSARHWMSNVQGLLQELVMTQKGIEENTATVKNNMKIIEQHVGRLEGHIRKFESRIMHQMIVQQLQFLEKLSSTKSSQTSAGFPASKDTTSIEGDFFQTSNETRIMGEEMKQIHTKQQEQQSQNSKTAANRKYGDSSCFNLGLGAQGARPEKLSTEKTFTPTTRLVFSSRAIRFKRVPCKDKMFPPGDWVDGSIECFIEHTGPNHEETTVGYFFITHVGRLKQVIDSKMDVLVNKRGDIVESIMTVLNGTSYFVTFYHLANSRLMKILLKVLADAGANLRTQELTKKVQPSLTTSSKSAFAIPTFSGTDTTQKTTPSTASGSSEAFYIASKPLVVAKKPKVGQIPDKASSIIAKTSKTILVPSATPNNKLKKNANLEVAWLEEEVAAMAAKTVETATKVALNVVKVLEDKSIIKEAPNISPADRTTGKAPEAIATSTKSKDTANCSIFETSSAFKDEVHKSASSGQRKATTVNTSVAAPMERDALSVRSKSASECAASKETLDVSLKHDTSRSSDASSTAVPSLAKPIWPSDVAPGHRSGALADSDRKSVPFAWNPTKYAPTTSTTTRPTFDGLNIYYNRIQTPPCAAWYEKAYESQSEQTTLATASDLTKRLGITDQCPFFNFAQSESQISKMPELPKAFGTPGSNKEIEVVVAKSEAHLRRFKMDQWFDVASGTFRIRRGSTTYLPRLVMTTNTKPETVCLNHYLTILMTFTVSFDSKSIQWGVEDYASGKPVAEIFELRFNNPSTCITVLAIIKALQRQMRIKDTDAAVDNRALTAGTVESFGCRKVGISSWPLPIISAPQANKPNARAVKEKLVNTDGLAINDADHVADGNKEVIPAMKQETSNDDRSDEDDGNVINEEDIKVVDDDGSDDGTEVCNDKKYSEEDNLDPVVMVPAVALEATSAPSASLGHSEAPQTELNSPCITLDRGSNVKPTEKSEINELHAFLSTHAETKGENSEKSVIAQQQPAVRSADSISLTKEKANPKPVVFEDPLNSFAEAGQRAHIESTIFQRVTDDWSRPLLRPSSVQNAIYQSNESNLPGSGTNDVVLCIVPGLLYVADENMHWKHLCSGYLRVSRRTDGRAKITMHDTLNENHPLVCHHLIEHNTKIMSYASRLSIWVGLDSVLRPGRLFRATFKFHATHEKLSNDFKSIVTLEARKVEPNKPVGPASDEMQNVAVEEVVFKDDQDPRMYVYNNKTKNWDELQGLAFLKISRFSGVACITAEYKLPTYPSGVLALSHQIVPKMTTYFARTLPNSVVWDATDSLQNESLRTAFAYVANSATKRIDFKKAFLKEEFRLNVEMRFKSR